jgi:hypothetical protein
MFQVTTESGATLVIRQISDRRPRGNYAKPLVEGSKLAQERLERRLAQTPFLWARRILQRFQTIKDQQGSAMRDELRESLALLPRCSESWIWIAKPTESRLKKFIG